jgi:hypothetical protein
MTLKRLLVGQPLETAAQQEQRLTKRIALAVFSSDALSSVAYASEAILGVLFVVGVIALPLVVPVSVAIVVLLLIVGFSESSHNSRLPQRRRRLYRRPRKPW